MSIELQPISTTGKTEQVIDALAELAKSLGEGAKLPTTRDLCKRMRISRHTLDAALDRLEIQGRLFRKQGSGIYVSPAVRTRRIAVVSQQSFLDPRGAATGAYHLLLSSLHKQCHDRNAVVTGYVHDPGYDQNRHGPGLLELDIERGRVDALIICGLDLAQTEKLVKLNVPAAFYTHAVEFEPRVTWRMSDFVTAGVRALVSRGCRRIGLAYWIRPDGKAARNCMELFEQAVRESGAETDFKWFMPYGEDTTAYRALEASRMFHAKWCDSRKRPDGLLSTNDEYTSGVLHAMEVLKVRSSEDLLVASHANKGMEIFGGIQTIRLEYDSDEKAKLLLDAVDDLLAGRPSIPERTVSHRLIWPELDETHV